MAVPTADDLGDRLSISRELGRRTEGADGLLVLLADGGLRSGEWLARQLGVSRAAVWKTAQRLKARGIDVLALPRQGYQLAAPVELFDEVRIRAMLAPVQSARLRRLELPFEVDSTNTRLLEAGPPPAGIADVMISELQRAGRGRRGKPWLAPFGGSIALSLGWVFNEAACASPNLSLAVGVALVRALERAGAAGFALKWPNDLWYRDRKVGGVLLEMRGEAGGPAYVVIGIGINVAPSPAARREIEAVGVRIAAVVDACTSPPSRNLLAGVIIDELLSMLAQFEQWGFAPFRDAWQALDALAGRPAQVLVGGGLVAGIARGIDARGALLLERDGRLHEFVSGEISLRLLEGET